MRWIINRGLCFELKNFGFVELEMDPWITWLRDSRREGEETEEDDSDASDYSEEE